MDSLSSPPFAQLSRGADPFDFLLRSKRLTALPWAGYNKGVSGPSPHHHLNMVDLSQFVGKHVVCKLKDDSILIGLVQRTKQEWAKLENYHYEVDGHVFHLFGGGRYREDIVSIELVEPKPQFTGIAQKAPNINLDDFTPGQTVYVKFKSGKYLMRELGQKSRNVWYIHALQEYKRNGITCVPQCDDRWDIEEIYSEGAYEITTKPTFDDPIEPVDPKVEEAKKLLGQMTEKQVAKLLKSLNK